MKYNKVPYNKKYIMKRAWQAARNACRKFGGKVKEYFAECLRLVWKFYKEEFGNTVKVPAWFLEKKTGFRPCGGFDRGRVTKETEKAVLVSFGTCDENPIWVPKSILLK